INWDNYNVSHGKSVEGCGTHGWRSVNDDNVEIAKNWLQFPAKNQPTIHLLGFKQVIRIDVNRVWQKFQAGTGFYQELLESGVVIDEHPVCGQAETIKIDS